jgi:hypothetical protein
MGLAWGAPATGPAERDEVEVHVLRLLYTARGGLQVGASPPQAIDVLIADDEPPPENADYVGKYLFPASADLGRRAGILHHISLTQPIEYRVVDC